MVEIELTWARLKGFMLRGYDRNEQQEGRRAGQGTLPLSPPPPCEGGSEGEEEKERESERRMFFVCMSD
jgi:hypothetical protein